MDKEQLYIIVKIFFLTKWKHNQNLAVQLYIHRKKHVMNLPDSWHLLSYTRVLELHQDHHGNKLAPVEAMKKNQSLKFWKNLRQSLSLTAFPFIDKWTFSCFIILFHFIFTPKSKNDDVCLIDKISSTTKIKLLEWSRYKK